MPKSTLVKFFTKCFLSEDLDEDLISNNRQSWLTKLDYFKSKLGIKKEKKINGKDIIFNTLLELFSDQTVGIDLNILEMHCTNQDIQAYIPQLCYYVQKQGRLSEVIEQFILQRAKNSLIFAHQVLWNYLSGLEMGGEALSMKTIQFLHTLSEHGKHAIEHNQNALLYLQEYEEEAKGENYKVYEGLPFNYEDPMPENSLINKLNFEGNLNLFFSTPKFLTNLISISEYLRTQPIEERKDLLREMISKVNLDLPNNVYMPLDNHSPHKILKISLDHCICLHSNEKAPFHILIEVEHIYEQEMEDMGTNGDRVNGYTSLEEVKKQNKGYISEGLLNESMNSGDSFDDETVSLRLSSDSNHGSGDSHEFATNCYSGDDFEGKILNFHHEFFENNLI